MRSCPQPLDLRRVGLYSSGDMGHAILWVVDLGSFDCSVEDGFTPGRCYSQASGSSLNSASNPEGFLLPSQSPLGSPSGQAQWHHSNHFHIPCGKWGMSESWKLAPAFGLQRWGRTCHVGSLGGPTHLADLELFDFSLIFLFPTFLIFRKARERKEIQFVPVPFSHHTVYSTGFLTSSMACGSSERGFFPWKISSTPSWAKVLLCPNATLTSCGYLWII